MFCIFSDILFATALPKIYFIPRKFNKKKILSTTLYLEFIKFIHVSVRAALL